VRLRVARTELRRGHNRRIVNPQGKAENSWLDPDGAHRGFFNPNVRVLVVEDAASGLPRGVISLYGVHPVTLGPGNTHASPDYPGHMVRAVESALPGCVAIHLTGATAQINPREALFAEPEKAAPLGQALAAAVLEALPHARPVEAVSLGSHAESFQVPLRSGAKPAHAGRATESGDGFVVSSEIQVIRLGSAALVSAPGELFAEIGVAMENTSPFDMTFVVGYANDHLGYLCTDTACREGGYESRTAWVDQVEPRLFDAARRALHAAHPKQ
jgi:hypothetical protein